MSVLKAYNELIMGLAGVPGYPNPLAKLAAYKGPKATPAPTAPAPTAGQGMSYLERFYAGLGPFGPPQPEETAPYTGGGYGYEGGGGYGGYGYPYYGGGGWGGGGVNINFGGGRQQQQIARLPTTPTPDIQGWLQSLINWNIGG